MSAPTPNPNSSNHTPQIIAPKSQQEALNVLVRALEVAQSRGVFDIYESAQIALAIDLFVDKRVSLNK